ncbi:MAG: type II secretion system F family protein [Chloroflexi bacterium]|nr:MAG: type II secretion system protein [Phototrophicales bacterium]RMF82304.1 MAG: type II secretion system F family protein [Chloroflexota bacterium]
MSPVIIGILVVVGGIIIAGLVYAGLKEDDEERDPLQERLAIMVENEEVPQSLEDIEMSMSFTDRVLLPFFKRLASVTAKFTPQKQIEETTRMIELAGMSGSMEPTTFFAIRVFATVGLALLAIIVFFVFGSVSPGNALLYTLGAGGLGYFYPSLWIRGKINKRQDAIIKALPDALDLLVIAVEAGLGFDAAMGKVYEKWDNELAIAFGRVLREIQLGKMRREALKDMSDRMDVPDVTAFTAAIIQADQLGVSMSTILRVQSDQMRTKRRQRAQEKAQQAPVKMMIPMVLLIFPSLWIVLLGPAVIRLIDSGVLGGF